LKYFEFEKIFLSSKFLPLLLLSKNVEINVHKTLTVQAVLCLCVCVCVCVWERERERNIEDFREQSPCKKILNWEGRSKRKLEKHLQWKSS